MYSHIIVPFDGDEPSRRAAGVGADLSRLFDNRLVVVTATPHNGGAEVLALKEKAQHMSDERVDVWIEPNHKPVDAIATTVKFRPKAMICMSTHGRNGLRRMISGSIAESVVARVDVPVMLLGPDFPGGDVTDIRQIIACVDDSATSQSVLPLAAQWARHLNLPITLAHVEPERHRRNGDGPDLEMMASLLERSAPRVEIIRHPARDATAGILDLIRPTSRSMAVMSTHSRTGMARHLAGSQVMKVVEKAQVPVLVARAGAKIPMPAMTSRGAARH